MVPYVTFHFGFFVSCLFPICIWTNMKQIKEEYIKKLQSIVFSMFISFLKLHTH